MHKTKLIFVVLLFIYFKGFAQKQITVLTNTKEVGKNIEGKAIKGIEYILPERIQDFQVDTINNYLTLQLRGLSRNKKWLDNKGYVVRYDTDKHKVLWSEKISYQTEHIDQYGGITLYSSGAKSYCIDNETGGQLWEVKNSLIFADPIDQIGIGYKIQTSKGAANLLEGVDLKNGNAIWQREINREFSWNDIIYLNDSTLLISAAGIHTLNIYNGTGWDYNTITGKKDYTASAIGTGLGIAAGLLTGMYSVTSGHNLVRDVVSNIIVDSLNIYLASKESIVKLDRNGNVQWQKALPNDLTSRSWIFKTGENLIMVNRGYAYMGSRLLAFGTPFLASFNINTGERNFLKLVTNDKKGVVRDNDVKGDTLLFVFKDRVSKYSLKDGALITEKPVNIEKYGEADYLVGERMFIGRDSTFSSLSNLGPTKHYLFTRNSKTLVLDDELNILDEINYEEMYSYYMIWNDLRFINLENKTIVLDESGSKIADLSASINSKLVGDKLYNVNEKTFTEINLNQLLQKHASIK